MTDDPVESTPFLDYELKSFQIAFFVALRKRKTIRFLLKFLVGKRNPSARNVQGEFEQMASNVRRSMNHNDPIDRSDGCLSQSHAGGASKIREKGSINWDQLILGMKKTTKEFVENVLGNIIESIVITTLDGHLVFFNKYSEEMFEFEAREVLNRHIAILRAKTPDVLQHSGWFDLLLVDIRMSGMDGIQLLEKVKAQRQSIQVIIMTGPATVETAVKAMKMGAYDYLSKPFEMEELLHLVKKVVEIRSLQ
jgi:CheY-like chemotaxis protein